ncbi:MAG: STAS/SEC14 domain-containing protein, partial [Gammaproteobacteria bacterium]|nr:STAS/SEC14 domain-containing protein [Gammaproteobacteria bacterium]
MRPIVSLTSKLGQEVMITIDSNNNQLSVNVYGELTLEDYQGLEKAILKNLESTPRINLLLDLTMMSGFTVDVAW